MPSDLAVLECQDRHVAAPDLPEILLYADDLLPVLQSTLAALADLDIRHEIEQDYLEEWSGPDEAKRHLRADLNEVWQSAREPFVLRLAELQRQIRAAGRGC